MSASNPFLRRALRFCELCGQFIGNMTMRDWERTGRLCRDCEERHSEPRMIRMDMIQQASRTYDMPS